MQVVRTKSFCKNSDNFNLVTGNRLIAMKGSGYYLIYLEKALDGYLEEHQSFKCRTQIPVYFNNSAI